ncbi:hypothetical protein F5144DRAFT_170863 [Chaetomium tenue]|uniref:Uncharacterized protein n=1 Tax=Chaetomium tenue TaxID=1854479 RepID=A0ACB7PD32_9PEZI|nr:hypothetical protein F5144DRAFT_170863 [Chaetomium globosum]
MTLKNAIAGNDMSNEPEGISLDLAWNFGSHTVNGELELIDDEERDPVEEEFRGTVDETMRGLIDLCGSMSRRPTREQMGALKEFSEGVIRNFKPKLRKRTRDGQTILHIFAQKRPAGKSNSVESMVYKAFISYFLMSSLGLIGYLDNEFRTPLSVAIKGKNYAFILACKMIPDGKLLDRIREELEAEIDCDDGSVETCLEMAVKKQGLPQEVRLELVRLAPQQAFKRTNKRGCTPLHLAVAYDSFEKQPADQVALVKALLEYGPEAMRVRTASPKGLSVYQYQEYTRSEKAKESAQQAKNTTGRRGSLRPLGLDRAANTEVPRGTQTLVPLEFQDREGGPKEKGPKADEMPKAKGNTGVSSTAKDILEIKTVDKGHGQGRVPQTVDGLGKHDDQFNEIKEELKLWHLRNEKPGDVVKYLHIPIRDQRRNIFPPPTPAPMWASLIVSSNSSLSPILGKSFWFDFGRANYSMTEAEFEAEFNHLEFDQSLKYVYFRHGKINPNTKSPCSYVDKSLGGCQGMVFFFGWLRRQGVSRILSVTVEDHGPQTHSDEAIEKAIGDFKVEVLDWKKVDLDAGVLHRVGGHLREVHLQWSGNNSALRAWSGPSGLWAIPTLEKVYLYARETLDSDKRREENLKTFKHLLETSREKGSLALRVDHTAVAGRGSGGGGGGGGAGKGKPGAGQGKNNMGEGGRMVYSHQWIKCMDDFVSRFRYLKLPQQGPSSPPKLLKPVVVALIDDGVDLPHHESADHSFTGESFHAYDYGRRVWPWWNSAAGHGTLMARLIHRICPTAVIYVIKLETRTTEADDTKILIDAESAIKAIHHAVEEGVDIISMSWTCVPKPELQKEWEGAIDAAARRGILMFCSASDRGQFGDRTFPHACRPNITFRVGAALPSGKVFDLVPDASSLDFALPGYQVFLEDDPVRQANDMAPSDKPESHTASSVATALAAGLAALVLEIVRIGLAHDLSKGRTDDSALMVHDLDVVRNRTILSRIFRERIGTSKDSAANLNKFIVVDDVFGAYARRLADDGPDDQLDTIADLAKHLLVGFRSLPLPIR